MTSTSKQASHAPGSVPITTTARFVVPGRERAPAPAGDAQQPVSPGRVPRAARLMALAIRFDGLVREGAVSTQAELAAAGHVTRARVTQIMNLLYLAPDLQEAVLHLPLVQAGRDPVTEHELRKVVAKVEWSEQRSAWRQLILETS